MKGLFVDDKRPVPEVKEIEWTVARTVTKAIELLDTESFDIVSLDRDISVAVTVGDCKRPFPNDESFEPVARFLRLMTLKNGPRYVVIHTSNKPRGEWMMEYLRVSGFILHRVRMLPSDKFEFHDPNDGFERWSYK